MAAAILDFMMAARDKKIENVSNAFVDLKTVWLDTKIMFLLNLEAEIWTGSIPIQRAYLCRVPNFKCEYFKLLKGENFTPTISL